MHGEWVSPHCDPQELTHGVIGELPASANTPKDKVLVMLTHDGFR